MSNEQKPVTNEQVLYAQAMQMALTIAGKTPNYSGLYPNKDFIIKHLKNHTKMANIIFEFIRCQI